MKLSHTFILLLLASLFISCDKDSDPLPVACFNTSNTNPTEGDTVFFDNCSTDAKYFKWTFGDGSSSNLESPTYIYNTPGEYTAILAAINDSHDTSIVTILIKVEEDNTVHEGQVVFWTDGTPPWDVLSWEHPTIPTMIWGDFGFSASYSITNEFATEPDCGTQGALTVTLPVGIYSYDYINPNTSDIYYGPSFTIVENECVKIKIE